MHGRNGGAPDLELSQSALAGLVLPLQRGETGACLGQRGRQRVLAHRVHLGRERAGVVLRGCLGLLQLPFLWD
jgi:hypothetical protein